MEEKYVDEECGLQSRATTNRKLKRFQKDSRIIKPLNAMLMVVEALVGTLEKQQEKVSNVGPFRGNKCVCDSEARVTDLMQVVTLF